MGYNSLLFLSYVFNNFTWKKVKKKGLSVSAEVPFRIKERLALIAKMATIRRPIIIKAITQSYLFKCNFFKLTV